MTFPLTRHWTLEDVYWDPAEVRRRPPPPHGDGPSGLLCLRAPSVRLAALRPCGAARAEEAPALVAQMVSAPRADAAHHDPARTGECLVPELGAALARCHRSLAAEQVVKKKFMWSSGSCRLVRAERLQAHFFGAPNAAPCQAPECKNIRSGSKKAVRSRLCDLHFEADFVTGPTLRGPHRWCQK